MKIEAYQREPIFFVVTNMMEGASEGAKFDGRKLAEKIFASNRLWEVMGKDIIDRVLGGSAEKVKVGDVWVEGDLWKQMEQVKNIWVILSGLTDDFWAELMEKYAGELEVEIATLLEGHN